MPSTVVSSIHFNATNSILRVIFVSGLIYDYKNVPEKVYKAMKTSSSKGTYLNQHIKGKYDFEKVN
ncbi:MAG: KTSC domain-containing protein [Chitinophagaceae bacterium]